ncbi:MAG TPA: hypothetical protein PKU97_05180, partial [Kofleriaceae bacterium]|nr:hypothetical protein [Kofleriaceae bacterium]
GAREVARALLEGPVLELHPCDEPTCVVGNSGAEIPFQVVLGADLFAGDALRLDLGKSRISVFPDIAGSASQRTALCEAVFPEPFRGGGTLVLGGTEVPYVGRRITVSSCVAPKTTDVISERGTDLMLLVSTALGPTLLSESAYQRYRVVRQAQTGLPVPELATLPAAAVTIPSGRLQGRTTTLPALTLVGQATDRGACGEVYWHKVLLEDDCEPQNRTKLCTAKKERCGAPAMVELSRPVQVLVIADAEPLLAGLRTELHPETPEVDGVLGTELLRSLELDIDYPNNRLLARCSAAQCTIFPDLPNLDTCERARSCRPAPAATARGR